MEDTKQEKHDIETDEKQELVASSEDIAPKVKQEKKSDNKILIVIIIILLILFCAAVGVITLLLLNQKNDVPTIGDDFPLVEATASGVPSTEPSLAATATPAPTSTPATTAQTFQLAFTPMISKDTVDFALSLPQGSQISLRKMQGWETNNIAEITAPNFKMEISLFYEAEPTHFDSYLFTMNHPQFGGVHRIRAGQTVYYTTELSNEPCFAGNIEAPCGPPVIDLAPPGQFFFAICDAEQQYKTECDAVISSLRVTWHELD
jgi:flagellar basal body-associated protein FliL